MRRDLDILRSLMLVIEEGDDGKGLGLDVSSRQMLPEKEHSLVYGHLQLLVEAGFIEADDIGGLGYESHYEPRRITWAGHEFLDSVRDPKIWSDTKKQLASVSDATSLEVVKAVAVSLTKLALGLN